MSDEGCSYIDTRRCWVPYDDHHDDLGHRFQTGHGINEPHRYRVACEICGQAGNVVLNIVPESTPSDTPGVASR